MKRWQRWGRRFEPDRLHHFFIYIS